MSSRADVERYYLTDFCLKCVEEPKSQFCLDFHLDLSDVTERPAGRDAHTILLKLSHFNMCL